MLVVVALSVNVRVVTHRDSFCVPVLLSTTLDERVTQYGIVLHLGKILENSNIAHCIIEKKKVSNKNFNRLFYTLTPTHIFIYCVNWPN